MNISRWLCAALLLFAGIGACRAQSLAGDWSGVVQGPNLQLIIHIRPVPGGFAATTDSIDQGATGFPTEVSIDSKNHVAVSLTTVFFFFTGVLNGDSIVGSWIQSGMSGPLTLVRLRAGNNPELTSAQTDFLGSWSGSLSPGGLALTVKIGISGGQFTGSTVCSGSQEGPLATDVLTLSGKSGKFVALEIGAPHTIFLSGAVSANAITGVWTRDGELGKVTLTRAGAPKPVAAPGNPALSGDWSGNIQGLNLHLVVHIKATAEGYSATADSPDQNAFGLPASVTTDNAGNVTVQFDAAPPFTFHARLDGRTLTGKWAQGDAAGSMTMTAAAAS